MNADGSNQTRLTTSTALESVPRWSPDGARIAFHTDRDGNDEIYMMNANGSQPTRLTNSPGSDLFTSWAPGGQRFAFHTNRDGNFEVYAMNVDGTGVVRLTQNTFLDNYPMWSSDGTDRKSTRLNSSHLVISYAVFCLKKKNTQ